MCASSIAGGGLTALLLVRQAAPPTNAAVSTPNISGNWAGYVAAPASASGVTSVSGSWTVPNAGSLPPGLSATWVGIGGFGSQDLIQTGTQQISSPFDQVISGGAYSAWYELLPAAPVTIGGTVTPGDHMTASVVNAGGNNWNITISDTTAGWTAQKSVTYASSESSAEWIHEAPSVGGVPIPVGNSGTVNLDLGSAVINGVTENLAQSGAIPVVALPVETAVSSLDPDGDGFNVCTYALTCAAPASS